MQRDLVAQDRHEGQYPNAISRRALMHGDNKKAHLPFGSALFAGLTQAGTCCCGI